MNWKKVVSQVAPTIGTALGGPGAGIAIKFLTENLLDERPEEGAEEAALAAVFESGGTEVIHKAKALDIEFQKFAKQLDLDFEKLAVQDRGNARGLMKHVTMPQIILSCVFVAGYMAVLIIVLVILAGSPDETPATPEWLRTLFIALIAILTTEINRVMAFWFGSSSGSRSKDSRLMAAISK